MKRFKPHGCYDYNWKRNPWNNLYSGRAIQAMIASFDFASESNYTVYYQPARRHGISTLNEFIKNNIDKESPYGNIYKVLRRI